MKKFFVRYYLQIIYLITVVWLIVGVVAYSGFQYMDYIAWFVLAFVIFSVTLQAALFNKKRHYFDRYLIDIPVDRLNNITYIIISFVLLFIVAHYIYLGQIPLLKAIRSDNNLDVAMIRQNITENKSVIFNYTSSIISKAIIPFFILLLYVTRQKRLLWLFVFISMFYIFTLMQKSQFFAIFFPVLVLTLLLRDLKSFVVFIIIPIIGIVLLAYIANPILRTNVRLDRIEENVSNQKGKSGNSVAYGIFSSLLHRIIIIPGKMVSEWFDVIPSKLGYANGCEYRFLAPVLNCEHTNYSQKVYHELYPEYVEAGLAGTSNTATFMYDYANFGIWGLIIAAFSLAVWFSLIQFLFSNNYILSISLNLFPLLMLTSAALSTMLLSGGWLFILLLYFIYKKRLSNPEKI